MEKEVLLSLKGVTYAYGERLILEEVSFEVERGWVFQIISDAGGGKSTLLNLCLGMLKPLEGEVKLFGLSLNNISYQRLKDLRRRIGFVFQESTPINNITVFENVALPLRYHTRLSEEKVRSKVSSELERFGILKYSDERPVKLSVNDKVKLDLARALVTEPELIFFDSPFLKMGFEDYGQVLSILRELKRKGVTLIIVSNDKMLTLSLSDRVGVMKGGKMLGVKTSQEIKESKDAYVGQLLSGEVSFAPEE